MTKLSAHFVNDTDLSVGLGPPSWGFPSPVQSQAQLLVSLPLLFPIFCGWRVFPTSPAASPHSLCVATSYFKLGTCWCDVIEFFIYNTTYAYQQHNVRAL